MKLPRPRIHPATLNDLPYYLLCLIPNFVFLALLIPFLLLARLLEIKDNLVNRFRNSP